jgi:hypothetical protein
LGGATFIWIALDWLIWACIAMSFRASPEGKVVAGDEIEGLGEDVVVANLDVYMPSTAKYMDNISMTYFIIIAAVVFLQALRSTVNCIWTKKEDVKFAVDEIKA